MIGVITKGRGYRVMLCALLPASVLLFAIKMAELFYGGHFPMAVYRALGGVALIVSAILCSRPGMNEVRAGEVTHEFMGMDMKSWTNIFWVLGGFMLLGTGIEILAFFH